MTTKNALYIVMKSGSFSSFSDPKKSFSLLLDARLQYCGKNVGGDFGVTALADTSLLF